MDDFNKQCKLSYTTRLYGFGIFFAIGAVLTIISAFMVPNIVTGHPERFALPYALGAICSIASTLFLMGPVSQCKSMFQKTRIVATIVYLGSIVMTLVMALVRQTINNVRQRCLCFQRALTCISLRIMLSGGENCRPRAAGDFDSNASALLVFHLLHPVRTHSHLQLLQVGRLRINALSDRQPSTLRKHARCSTAPPPPSPVAASRLPCRLHRRMANCASLFSVPLRHHALSVHSTPQTLTLTRRDMNAATKMRAQRDLVSWFQADVTCFTPP